MHQYSQDGHSGSTFWLTGANRYGIPGQSFHNTVSVAQVPAEVFGENTRFTSIQPTPQTPSPPPRPRHPPRLLRPTPAAMQGPFIRGLP